MSAEHDDVDDVEPAADEDETWQEHDDDHADEDGEPRRKYKKSDNSLHRENAKYRVQRNAARAELDDERVAHAATRARVVELEAQLRDGSDPALVEENRVLRTAVLVGRIAAIAGAHDPAALLPFVDHPKVTIASDGTVTGLDEEVARLRESKPFLFRPVEGEVPVADDPFRVPRRTGRPTNVAGRRPGSAASASNLRSKYPALRGGR